MKRDTSPVQRWYCPYKQTVALKEWEDGCVCFLERHDTNHLLTPVAGATLQALLHTEVPLSAAELFNLIFGSESDNSCASASPEATEISSLESILREFKRIGLAESYLS